MVKTSIKKWYHVVIEPYMKNFTQTVQENKYSRAASVLLTVALVVMAGLWGYRWWNHQRETTAQKAFGECLYAYQEALGRKDSVGWNNVAMLFNIGYERHASSSLAPYFLMFHADALLNQGNSAEALLKMNDAIIELPADSPLINLYKTKRALVKLDDEISAMSQEGLRELKTLADDIDNSNRDMALYYLGLYYWAQNNIKEAKISWNELVNAFKHEKIGASPWATQARSKLEQIPHG